MAKKAFLVLLIFTFIGCVFAVDETSQPFTGVTRIHRTLTSPRPLNINILIIDLTEPTISFKVTPSNGDTAGETTAQTVAEFVQQENAQIGINCGFFFWNSTIGGYDVMGYAASLGDTYSYFTAWADWPQPYVSLNISSTNQVDMIYPIPNFPIGQYVAPFGVEVYNAAPGSEWIVTDGVVTVEPTWQHSSELHPRTAAGYTQDGNSLILITIDGRQSGFSEGMTITETAQQLVGLGVYQGINFDGGGSTAMYFGSPYYQNVNVPIDGGVPGQQRNTANNLVIFAEADTNFPDFFVFNDFEDADEGTFAYSPGYSGSTQGITASQSTADAVNDVSWNGQWAERIYIEDDSATTAVTENPDGGWFVRWVSGATANPSQNITAPAQGCVGFWAKNQADNMSISLCIDNAGQMERGLPIDMPNDGYWHCYQWDLEDDLQWESWINGDGIIIGSDFTLDSIHIFGPDENVELFIDDVSINVNGSLDVISDCNHVFKAGLGLAADLDRNCFVGMDDLLLLTEDWLLQSVYDLYNDDELNIVNFSDFSILAKDWLYDNEPNSF